MAIDSKSLMLGDWVRRRWTCRDTGREVVKDFQLTAIQKIGESLYAWGKNGNMGRVEDLEPIPLTPEVLEKNGFVYNELPFVQGWEQYGLTLTVGGGGFRVSCGQNVAMIIDSVHELQNALRLCGITLNIEV